jgi:hypothetical protein
MRKLSLPFVLCIATLVGAAPALAAATLDQSQEVDGDFSIYQPHTEFTAGATGVAQTFTAGLSGQLSSIEVELSARISSTEPLTVEIRADDPTGGLLATANVPSASVPAFPAFAWIPFTFSTPATVTAGDAYAIVLPPGPFTGAFDPQYAWSIDYTDVYANGRAWDHYGGDLGSWQSYVFGSDRTFRTYVDPAPPDPGQQISKLIETITSMGLPMGTTTALTAELNAAAAALAGHNGASACGSLGAFVNLVNALDGREPGPTHAQATLLGDAATQVGTAAGCG